jgi:ketosteroid isomerase-like protein
MSPANVELVRDLKEQWNRGERSDTPAFHPDVEFLPLRAATEGSYRGIAGIEKFVADTEQTFNKFELRTEVLDLGERVLAWGTIHVRARQSGIETDIPTGGLFDFRDGKIVRWEDFGSKEKALEAARLEG